jgi:hypothetical protein
MTTARFTPATARYTQATAENTPATAKIFAAPGSGLICAYSRRR